MKRFLIGSLGVGMVAIGCEREAPPVSNPPRTISPPSHEAEVEAPPTDAGESDSTLTAPAEAPPTPPAAPPAGVSPPAESKPAAASNLTPPADSKVATFAGLTGPKPVTWIWRPPQTIAGIARLAEYAVPGRDGSDQAGIAVYEAGGTIEQNIARWKTQFRSSDGSPAEAKVSTLESDGMPITVVEFAGEYRGMGMASFKPGQIFLCAIVQAPAGQIFVRFIGPSGTIEPNREPFMAMIRNLKKVDPEK